VIVALVYMELRPYLRAASILPSEEEIFVVNGGRLSSVAASSGMQARPERCLWVVVGTFRDHFDCVVRLLESFEKFLLQSRETCFLLVVSDEQERQQFSALPFRFPRLNLKVQNMEKLAHEILKFADFSSEAYLSNYGKYNYQSLKKYIGLKYVQHIARRSPDRFRADFIVSLDSESFALRPFSFLNWTFEHSSNRRLFYLENCRPGTGLGLMKYLIPSPGWLLEYYQWIYEDRILDDLTEFMSANSFDWFKLSTDPGNLIFIEVFYYSFLFNKNSENNYGYSFLSSLQTFLNVNNITEDQLKAYVPAIYGRANFLEDTRVHVRSQFPLFTRWLTTFYQHYSLRTFKPEDDPSIWEFLKESRSIQVVVSDPAEALYSKAMTGFFNDGTYMSPF